MKWVLALLLMIVVGAALFVTNPDLRNTAKRERSGATSSRLSTDEEQRLIFASGIVEGAHRDVHLQFEIQGRLQTVHVIEGMHEVGS